MPTPVYAQSEEIRRLRHQLTRQEWATRDLTGLIRRYMRHVIETKGTSYLDRCGLMPTDSKALTLMDLSVLRAIEKEVMQECVMPSRAVGRSTGNTGDSSKES